jgi:DNA-binding response OmpR family regulator
MVTALDDIESINRAFEAGGTNFVTKPVNWTVLAFHVKYILRASQNAEELNKTKQLLTLARESAEVVHKKQRMISSTDLESFTSDNP